MGKLITIPTAVGWSPSETIQLTVVHRHHKITFCQQQHLFDSFQNPKIWQAVLFILESY